MITVQQLVKTKLMIAEILRSKLRMHTMDKDTQEEGIIVTDQLEVVGVDTVEVTFIEALQKSLILTGIQLAEMEDPTDVIYVSPFFIGQLIASDKPVNKAATNQETVHVQLFAEGVEQCFLEQVVLETLNCALLDTSCSANVCVWYQLAAMLCRLIAY